MRKALTAMLGFVAAATLVAAQGHDNATELKASGMMIVASDVRIGSHVLVAGDYRVVCDRHKITFVRLSNLKTALEATCKGKALAAPSEVTILHTETRKDGQKHVVKLLLRGSNVEHVFE